MKTPTQETDSSAAKSDYSPELSLPTGSSTRKAGGWHPVLEYTNGGRVIGALIFGSSEQARFEAWEMVECIENNPGVFSLLHPQPNQLIDLRENEE